jgi:hypothetical protein
MKPTVGFVLGKLSDKITIQTGLKQEEVLSPLLFNLALEQAISEIEGNQEELKLYGYISSWPTLKTLE